MCGIALIVSGIRLDCSTPDFNTQQLTLLVEHIEAALRRRGPDSLGSKKLFLRKTSSNNPEQCIVSWIDEKGELEKPPLGSDYQNGLLKDGATNIREGISGIPEVVGEMYFIGATLQLRGIDPITQPFVDNHGNVLVYNGEIFGGIIIGKDNNDGEILFQHLGNCCCCKSHDHSSSCSYSQKQLSVPDALSRIKGPWAIIYWQDSSKTLWFGRDAFGRRSLLVHWPTAEDPRFLLSSVSPSSPTQESSDAELENGHGKLKFWEELPCGIHSMTIDSNLVGDIKKHDWSNSSLEELIQWERTYVDPREVGSVNFAIQPNSVPVNPSSGPAEVLLAEKVMLVLKESVKRRTTLNTFFQAITCDPKQHQIAPVAVLFSGGLDSMILAALLDQCLDPIYEVDLLNVSFDGASAPDRITARTGTEELRKIAPLRRWRLVEIDAALSSLKSELKHVMSLIHPSNTYMDLNIGMALWLAARGKGWVYEGRESKDGVEASRMCYHSHSRILLVGSGADEQCAGYGRHRTSYRKGSWVGLNEEMRLDMQRIWKRNLGRDDRCISDNGKEARFPFLDEDVIKVLLDIPLWEIADLEQPSGIGDKKILRQVARLLGLSEASTLPKRAIQFGSRIARESNRKNFGSNRAANQASAGSVTIQMT